MYINNYLQKIIKKRIISLLQRLSLIYQTSKFGNIKINENNSSLTLSLLSSLTCFFDFIRDFKAFQTWPYLLRIQTTSVSKKTFLQVTANNKHTIQKRGGGHFPMLRKVGKYKIYTKNFPRQKITKNCNLLVLLRKYMYAFFFTSRPGGDFFPHLTPLVSNLLYMLDTRGYVLYIYLQYIYFIYILEVWWWTDRLGQDDRI
eukprot:TRINITY_DN17612_c0_g2_i1.p2 TRINITY_DN17612_c0_g2~~TRINITY_DN17612_c0_g2_i1.p2  ORF type:complete len:201 (+),score=-12.89 TRINITY_DN17612_c0_g2_i1:372-974(+)